MSRVINERNTLSFLPFEFSGGYYKSITDENNPVGKSETATTYTRFYMNDGIGGQGYVFYKFNTQAIPKDATISSISCTAKIAVSSTTYITARNVQLYHDKQNPKGSSTSWSSTSGESVSLACGTWTGEEVQDCYIRVAGARGNSSTDTSAYITFYGATLTISYTINGTYYMVTSDLDADIVDSISPNGDYEVFKDSTTTNSYVLTIESPTMDGVIVKDNDVDVTSQVVTHTTVTSGTVTAYPESVTVTGGVLYNASPSTLYLNAIGKSAENPDSSTNNVYHPSAQSNNTFIDYYFDFSEIPVDATIDSISVKVAGHYETVSNYTTVAKCTLYSGTSEKGSSASFSSTSSQVLTLTPGTWNRAELAEGFLRFEIGVAGGLVTGVTWTVNWSLQNANASYYTYTINAVTTDHEIEVLDNYSGVKYQINTTVGAYGVTASPLSKKVRSGRDFTLNIYAADTSILTFKDNGTIVNSSITGSDGIYYYILTGVNRSHTITINENPWYEITGESTYENATIQFSSSKVYEGNSATITVNVSNISLIDILDNGTDVTSSFSRVSTGVYTMTLSNVSDDHEFIVLEANKYSLTAISNTNNASIDPNGVSSVSQGESKTYSIYTDLSTESLILKDNDVDVTSNLVSIPASSGTDTVPHTDSKTVHPTGTTGSSNITTNNNYPLSNGYNGTSNTSSYARLQMGASNTSTQCYIYYTFSVTGIPAGATINSVTCTARIYRNSRVTSTIQLYANTTAKGSATTFTNTSASNVEITNTGSWTVNDLSNLRLRISGTRTSTYQTGYIYFYGADVTINYTYDETVEITIPAHLEYTVSNVAEEHTITLYEVFIPEDEDETKTYHSITISSINATTNPNNGTIRVEEGDSQTITITATEAQITLITDNGTDVRNDLVVSGGSLPTYTVTGTVSGASYGFTLNSSTGYYTSTNEGRSNSAAVCRVNFSFPSRTLVTIEYINYSEATYDYGIFGQIDTALATTYTSDSNAYKVLSASSDNSASPQTLTYEIDSGSHYIDIKYRKDQATDSNNDNFQWKISSMQLLESSEYTYTLNNISEDHSLVFIFGEVVYYTTTSSGTGCKLYPTGSFVNLPNETYSLTIVPDKPSYGVEIYDNGRDISRSLTRVENNYVYTIKKVTSNHTITVNCYQTENLYVKVNGVFIPITKAYVKVNGVWVEQDSFQYLFDSSNIYVRGN